MECGNTISPIIISTKSTPMSSSPSTSSLTQSPPSQVIQSPCAACKLLRRRCAENCVLAPYFPPTDPLRFAIAHRVFGASNIIKFLQQIPECQRADAVSSMVYEANARIRDPVYGSTGAIWYLQKQVIELQAELAKAQAEITNMRCHHSNLLDLTCMGISQSQHHLQQQQESPCANTDFSFDNSNFGLSWGPL